MARERKFSTKVLFQEGKELLLQHGYEGFNFGILAERLEVARGTIYKYYENKEEFITDYMIHEMHQFLEDLKQVRESDGFEEQLGTLLGIIYRHSALHQVLGMAHQIQAGVNEKVRLNKQQLEKLHLDMYGQLQDFIRQGREEELLNPALPDGLVLGMIFQTIDIPNHFGVPKEEWLAAIKQMICHGIYKSI